MRKQRKQYSKSCALSEIVSVRLCGYEQKILIEARHAGLPVVLFLHGGPGFPAPFCVGARGLFPQITNHFTAVYWDQLGCGINNRKIGDDFTISRFVDMTVELVSYLKARFSEQPLYLFAISWGSVLSAYTAARIPEALAGVYAAGQVVLPPMRSEAAFGAIASSRAPKGVKQKIGSMQRVEIPTIAEIALLSKTLRKYTNAYTIKNKDSAAENPMKEIFASGDYSFLHKIACFYNGYAKNRSLLKELSAIDLSETLATVRVPYRIYAGGCDLVTAASEARELVSAAGNHLLTVREIADEGHIPSEKTIEAIFADMAQEAGL